MSLYAVHYELPTLALERVPYIEDPRPREKELISAVLRAKLDATSCAHRSPNIGVVVPVLSAHGQKLIECRLDTRHARNRREHERRSMERYKWPRRLGKRLDRKWRRNAHDNMIDFHIAHACDMLRQDAAVV